MFFVGRLLTSSANTFLKKKKVLPGARYCQKCLIREFLNKSKTYKNNEAVYLCLRARQPYIVRLLRMSHTPSLLLSIISIQIDIYRLLSRVISVSNQL